MTEEQMFVSKLLLGPSRLVLRGGLTDAFGAFRRQAANPRSGAARRRIRHDERRPCNRGRVHSRQYANVLVCRETIQLQESGSHTGPERVKSEQNSDGGGHFGKRMKQKTQRLSPLKRRTRREKKAV